MILKRKIIIYLALTFTLSFILSGNVLGEEPITEINSDLEGYFNLNEFEEKSGTEIKEYKQSPMLMEREEDGEIPSLDERLPDNPSVLIPWKEIGEYGGTLRWCEFTSDYDHYLRHINTASLLEEHTSAGLYFGGSVAVPHEPGILSEWEVGPEAKEYTFKIREGLKWSDGEPVTTEDVDYCINDVSKNEEITPIPPAWLRWQGGETELNIIDDYTFELVFDEPYGVFIEEIVRQQHWSNFLRPKHFFSQFHKDYTPWDELLPVMEEMGFEDKESWGTFYGDVTGSGYIAGGALIQIEDIAKDLPTLDPYVPVEIREDGTWIFERNPYFYLVDTEGNQLPYIDKYRRQYISNEEMVNMEIIQGNTDVQTQFLSLSDYPMFKEKEADSDYKVYPVTAWQGQMLMYVFNLAIDNEVFPREVIEDLRFRKALSYALNREQIKQSIFLDMGKVSQLGPSPDNPVYEEWMSESYAEYDPERAKELLDDMGIVDNDGDGWREWNEEKLRIPIMYYKVTPPATSGAETAKRYWEEIGLQVDIRQVDGNFLWERQGANKLFSTVWWLGGPVALGRTDFLVPFGVNMPEWNQWWDTDGEEGIEPLPWAKDMYEARQNLLKATTEEKKLQYSKEIWELQAEYIPLIGTVADTPIPFVFNKNLGNIEVDGLEDYTSTRILEAQYQWFFKE